MANTIRRGLFHALATLFFPVSGFFLSRAMFLGGTAAILVALLLLELLRLRFATINRWFIFFFRPVMREREFTTLAASIYISLSALIAFLLFEKEVAIVAICFLAVGDPLSGILGNRFGRMRIFNKSMEGNLTCFLSSLVVGLVLSWSILDISPFVVLIGAFSAAFIQALPLPLNDNLTIPLFSGLCMSLVRMLSGINAF